MIKAIHFHNFRVLRDTTLPLAGVTVIIGPNGSGKSTALLALRAACGSVTLPYMAVASIGAAASAREVEVGFEVEDRAEMYRIVWPARSGGPSSGPQPTALPRGARVFSLDAEKIAAPAGLNPSMELEEDGAGLARVLTGLQDRGPEQWEALNQELRRWMPDFDRVLLNTPGSGHRSFLLRTRSGRHEIEARELSHGTLLALALLTLAYLPEPPSVIGLEEPDRGIHPRLLRQVQDALYRLSTGDEHRPPVQVIVTTHSPYFVDLFRDHPEEVVIAQKQGLEAKFERLSDQPHIDEILRDAHLGDVWYSGVLGGVPVES